MRLITELRKNNIVAELYPDNAKMKKQFDYAARKGVKEVAFLGSKEIAAKEVTLKDQESGQQRTVPFSELVNVLKD
jgi:histidyl-tRNA synthetase